MSEAIARREELTLGQEQVSLLAKTLSQAGLSEQEFYLYIEYVKRTKLDPFVRQLYAIKDKGRMSIIVGIDGLRVIAQRTGELDGQDGPYWKAQDGPWLEVWDSEEPPYACKVEVYRRGAKRPFKGLVRYDSFVRFNKDGEPLGNWATMPDHMLAIRAESHALRKAFPAETAGLYVSQDDQEADGEAYIVHPEAKASNDQIAALHLTAQDLGWNDEQRRAFHGNKHANELTSGEASHYLSLMKRLIRQSRGLAGGGGTGGPGVSGARPAESSEGGTGLMYGEGMGDVPPSDDTSGTEAPGEISEAPSAAAEPGPPDAPEPSVPDFILPSGRYAGVECSKVAIQDPDYLRLQLDKLIPSKRAIAERHLSAAPQES